MQISGLRREIAPVFEMTPESFRQLQRRVPDLMPDKLATNASSALLILVGMLGGDRETIGDRAARMWRARCVRPFDDVPSPRTLGLALTLLLQRAELRADLDYLELNHDIPDFLLMFKNQSRLFYAPYSAANWQRRVDTVTTLTRTSKLRVTTLDKVAALIAQEGHA